MRVLLASPYNGKGGITKWTEHIMTYYHNGHCDSIELKLLPMDRHPFSSPLTRLYYGISEYSRIIMKEWSMLRHGQYDVLHLCTSADISLIKDWIILRIALHFHVRTVLHFHFGRIPSIVNNKGWEWWLLSKVMRYVDVTIPIDKESYGALKRAGFSKIIYVPNPLSPTVPAYVDSYINLIQRDERMVLFVGECLRDKGIYELVEACRDIPDIHLVLAGYIEESTKQDLIKISKEEEMLKFLGQMPYEEVLRLMMICGIFVLPSYTEGFPNVILESMACGCAIIATTVGAIPELIGEEDGRQNGVLIPPRNADALKKALNQLLNDGKLKDTCRYNVRCKVKKYNMESIWLNLVDVWHLACEEV